MSFPRYPAYKDSGLAWLGEVPTHWGLSQSRRLFQERKDRATEGDRQLTASQKHGVIYQDDFMALEGQKVMQVIHGADILKRAEPNDFVISMRSFQGGIEWCGLAGSISSAYVMLIPDDSVVPGYFRYLFKSSRYVQALQSTTNLVRDGQALRFANFVLVDLPVVPRQEQTAIATFLDHETAKIDALVTEQERLIELLKEKRQAVISHAVTKGLDPSVPMKDSGVEWLGEVPAHWEVARVKQLVKTIEQGWSPQCESFPVGSESEWGVLKVGCVNGGIFNPEENKALPPDLTPLPELGISAGDLLISRANTRELVGSAAAATSDHHNLMLCDKLYRLRVDAGRCLPTFLSLFLGTEQVRGQIELAATGASSSMLNISQATILELCLALPPMAEQQELLQAVDVSVAQLDQLVGEVVLSSELLRERRTALISAAVTGQIDVRGWTPPTDAP